jgi:hypothetical protein
MQRQAAVVALLLSIAAHLLLLTPSGEKNLAQGQAAPSLRQGLQTRTLPSTPVPQAGAQPSQDAPAPRPSQPGLARAKPVDQESPSEPSPGSHEPTSMVPDGQTSSNVASPATQVATAVEWRFLLLQDGRQGLARLSWLPQKDTSYQLRLDRQLDGRPLPGWRSEGKVGPEGLLPERFAQQRRGRDAQATNFRRQEGLISFSTTADVFELPEGVQDRLSWWFQLAAILDAAPERYPAGGTLHMTVIGLRGEARDWAFEVIGPELLDLPDRAALPTLHLHRPKIFTHSGEIDVWLDPSRRHLPVRLIHRLPDERSWELLLMDDGLAP